MVRTPTIRVGMGLPRALPPSKHLPVQAGVQYPASEKIPCRKQTAGTKTPSKNAQL